ncbi:MAG: LarC family nickel insertion protein [Planctomycetes bacterium]|nr:LarC family nickel insertion protein [Planctomycetota bacterium]
MGARILIIDPASGAAGDMFLGAFADLGVDFDALGRALATLPAGGFQLRKERVLRGGVSATKVHVHLDVLGGGEEGPGGAVLHGVGAHQHEGHAPHWHAGPQGGHGEVRHLAEILKIIHASALPSEVKSLAIHAFRLLGEAEARAHNCSIDAVHFHEVGATDAIVDICGTALLFLELGVTRVFSLPVATGSGVVACAHGTVPVPAPATQHLLGDFPLRQTLVARELLTPTGAALLRALNPSFVVPRHRVVAEGYGAGSLDLPLQANVLKLTVAELPD